MKGKRRDNQIAFMAGVIFLVLAIGAVGFSVTGDNGKEKAQKTKIAEKRAENKGAENMQTNPLRQGDNPEILRTVEEYYEKLTEEKEFVEDYRNIQTYIKNGKYEDTYVAFVKYGMKIKDIYTEVPGLRTLYVIKDGTSGKYRIYTEALDHETQQYIKTVAAHEDVQKLMEKENQEYKKAVQSDALLREALADLRKAYEDGTGN